MIQKNCCSAELALVATAFSQDFTCALLTEGKKQPVVHSLRFYDPQMKYGKFTRGILFREMFLRSEAIFHNQDMNLIAVLIAS